MRSNQLKQAQSGKRNQVNFKFTNFKCKVLAIFELKRQTNCE